MNKTLVRLAYSRIWCLKPDLRAWLIAIGFRVVFAKASFAGAEALAKMKVLK